VSVSGRLVVCPTGRSVLSTAPLAGSMPSTERPVWKEDTLFVSAAYGGGCAALEIVPGDDAWKVRERWTSRKSLQCLFATPMVLGGHIYGMHGDLAAFQLKCLDLKTGDVKWAERVSERYGLVAAEGHVLAWGERYASPLWEGREDGYGYVCRDFACRAPVDSVDALLAELDGSSPSSPSTASTSSP